jgi:hypothetical protein
MSLFCIAYKVDQERSGLVPAHNSLSPTSELTTPKNQTNKHPPDAMGTVYLVAISLNLTSIAFRGGALVAALAAQLKRPCSEEPAV